MSILVVDDSDDIRDLLLEILRDEGYEADGAQDGEAALAFLALWTPRPRLILLDLMMPVMNGWQFVQAVRAHPVYVAIPIVLMSAGANLHEARRALSVADSLTKPINIPHLLGLVHAYYGPPGAAEGEATRTA